MSVYVFRLDCFVSKRAQPWRPTWLWRMRCPMWTCWRSCHSPTSSHASSLHPPPLCTRYSCFMTDCTSDIYHAKILWDVEFNKQLNSNFFLQASMLHTELPIYSVENLNKQMGWAYWMIADSCAGFIIISGMSVILNFSLTVISMMQQRIVKSKAVTMISKSVD